MGAFRNGNALHEQGEVGTTQVSKLPAHYNRNALLATAGFNHG